MTLIEIKQHLAQVKIASLNALCAYFHSDPLLTQSMLAHWVRKGCVRKCMKTPACGQQCFKCNVAITEIYEWVEIV